MQAIGGLLVSLLYLFVFVIFIRSILSWFPMSPYNPIKSALDQITEHVQTRVMNSEDRREGARAFREKRQGVWHGR